jgi:hypothetical protein
MCVDEDTEEGCCSLFEILQKKKIKLGNPLRIADSSTKILSVYLPNTLQLHQPTMSQCIPYTVSKHVCFQITE